MRINGNLMVWWCLIGIIILCSSWHYMLLRLPYPILYKPDCIFCVFATSAGPHDINIK